MTLGLRLQWVALVVVLAAVGCEGDPPPADVEGNYTINITNRQNGCMLQNWTVDQSTAGIPITIDQNGSAIDVRVEGLAGTYVSAVFGTNEIEGGVAGSRIAGSLESPFMLSMGACDYNFLVTLDATVNGDVISGTLTYTAETDGVADCMYLNTCSSVQQFNGTRPPR